MKAQQFRLLRFFYVVHDYFLDAIYRACFYLSGLFIILYLLGLINPMENALPVPNNAPAATSVG